jgi:hypothetical protein
MESSWKLLKEDSQSEKQWRVTLVVEEFPYLSFPRRRESRGVSKDSGFLLSQE